MKVVSGVFDGNKCITARGAAWSEGTQAFLLADV